jgi:DNA-binding transcriptional MerR regulator
LHCQYQLVTYSLADLCDLADVTPRTVRYYIAQGLLRPPTGAGPAARYDDGHRHRLALIRQLQRGHLPLAEIRKRLDALDDADVERLVTEPPAVADTAAEYIARVLGSRGLPPPPTPLPRVVARAQGPPAPGAQAATSAERAAPATGSVIPTSSSTPEPLRSQWDRFVLDPDVELHVRRPLSRDQNRRVERLLDAARGIFQEETASA